MIFNSFSFLVFLPVVLAIYWILPGKIRTIWLLAASYYFYMCWNAKYAILIFFLTIITYLSGILIEKSSLVKIKKLIVFFSVAINIGILIWFKYINFALDLTSKIFSLLHVQMTVPVLDILLPVGISFYTFQALSYTIDVYRGDTPAERDFFRYALFVSFFPQLVAGPIERSKNLLSQLAKKRKPSYDMAREGFLLMIWGYFVKLVIADRIAVFVDTVYGDYNTYGGLFIVIATVFFAIQIYCDFAGYSAIAIGTAKLFGINLMENFNAPFLSTSIAELWKRWHISLTSWFRDYMYIPLGGSKKGKFRKCLNVLIVFLVSGLWHGANLTYVVWGGINGLYQVISEILKPVKEAAVRLLKINVKSAGHLLLKGLVTFSLFVFSLIFFRAESLTDSINIIKSLAGNYNPWILFDDSIYSCGLDIKNFRILVISVCVLIFTDICNRCGIKVRNVIMKQDYWCRCLVMIVAICFILIFGKWGSGYDANGFIYFQF